METTNKHVSALIGKKCLIISKYSICIKLRVREDSNLQS